MQKLYPYQVISPDDDYTDIRNLQSKKSLPKSEQQMRFNSDLDKCGEVTVPQNDRDKGKDSDLHIYAQYLNNDQLSFVAYAANCQFVYKVGPSHGQITFNLGQLEKKDLSQQFIFQDILEIVIHEMTHVLGFTQHSIPLWIQSDKSSYVEPTIKKKFREIDTLFLKTPKVLQFARKYFNCPSLTGVPLENLGGPGSANSHWKNTIINGEYMNSQQQPLQSYFSGFTANLLRDTGFYEEIKESMEEDIFYGKGAGCQHVTGQCNCTKNEFCIPIKEQDLCDFYHIGASNCIAGQFNEPNCLCYKYECSSNGQLVTIHVGKQKVVCTKNLEKMQVNGYDGTICVCNKGYFGNDCSLTKPILKA
ncbi:leishmanolysin family protein, putative [Ichthyophthirius multifiliis]|uniref:Leishmanolysin family protein, putative n=1 Tax=Ichthyophthirius multifiliis TaxID=5932 RepID=G0QM59_ICHMU|nr:leishmanolysin family protein, putative [Ichthyophthirius multifiliis]EGR33695.1 leishmanolysin family protein, putative [Ichthyophthirius multifiliis]|eukprot:XP_004037681.1 leishmanolysin family protein, putative [Ichthyophthirius multifiliis]